MSEGEPMDTSRPMEIVEEEELERISSLLQRDNLVRGLGIVEHVYRLLHCTPGTTATQVKNVSGLKINYFVVMYLLIILMMYFCVGMT